MVDFDKDMLIKIAKYSGLELDESEIEAFSLQLKKILEYSEQLSEVAEHATLEPATQNMNVFRDDKQVSCDAAPLLAQAPETEDTYFVVPKILS